MVAPLIVAGLTALGGFLAGKSGSGSTAPLINTPIEIGTSKKQTTVSNQITNTKTTSYTSANSYNLVYGSPNASISNTPSTSTSLTPTITPSIAVLPSLSSSSGGATPQSSGFGLNFYDIAIFGALGVGAYYLVKKAK